MTRSRLIPRLFSIITLFSSVLLAGQAGPVSHVFIVSFDQTGPSHVAAADMPAYKAMAAEGAHTWEAYTIVPSITLPSHTSMVTGVGIQKHQIKWNSTWTPERDQLHVPTIFEIAHKQGLSTAVFTSKQKFKLFDVRGGVDYFKLVEAKDGQDVNTLTGEAVAKYVREAKPAVTLVHFGDPDAKGHRYGAMSPEKMASLATADAALAVIRDAVKQAGILDSTVFILTADHGAHDTVNKEGKTVGTHGSADPIDVTIPWVAWGATVKPHFEIKAPVVTYDSAATALWLLGIDVPQSFWGRPVTSAFAK